MTTTSTPGAIGADALADKCEAWLQAGGASNIVDAYEAGYREAERAALASAAQPTDAAWDKALRERDDADDYIDALLDEVLGADRAEWSSLYGRADALNDVRERMTALEKPAIDRAWGRFEAAMAAPAQPGALPWNWLRGVIKGIPARVEPLGGQRTSYVQLDEVLGWLDEGERRAAFASAAQPIDEARAVELALAHGGWLVLRGGDPVALYPADLARLLAAAPKAAPARPTHPDDAAVDAFAAAMKEKLAAARAKGRGGWQYCDSGVLSGMLREHVSKGDPRDVANFCMFLWSLGQPIAQPDQQTGAAYADLPDERAPFEAAFPVPGGVTWNGSEYVVKDDYLDSYRCDRFVGQWEAWQARASSGQAPAPAAVAQGASLARELRLLVGVQDGAYPNFRAVLLEAASALDAAPAAQGDVRLWCVNVQGPDDVHAMPAKAEALERANQLNELFGKHPYEEGDPIMRAVVIEWPHSADAHKQDLADAARAAKEGASDAR